MTLKGFLAGVILLLILGPLAAAVVIVLILAWPVTLAALGGLAILFWAINVLFPGEKHD